MVKDWGWESVYGELESEHEVLGKIHRPKRVFAGRTPGGPEVMEKKTCDQIVGATMGEIVQHA